MFGRKMYFMTVIAIVTLFVLSSCNDDEDKKISLEVTDIELVDIGKIPYEFEFTAESISDNIQSCKIRTVLIKKDDEIESIVAIIQGNNLTIDIVSYPFDFDCGDESCFTVHDVSFNLVGMNKGTYNVCVRTNYSETKRFSYNIK